MRLGPLVAGLILAVTVFSFAGAFAFEGIPDTETGLFWMMAAVVGVERHGIHLVSPGWRLVARAAGIGALATLVAVVLLRNRGAHAARSA